MRAQASRGTHPDPARRPRAHPERYEKGDTQWVRSGCAGRGTFWSGPTPSSCDPAGRGRRPACRGHHAASRARLRSLAPRVRRHAAGPAHRA